MLFFLTTRVTSSLVAFLYPGYASYKTLSQRPASEEDLERWLMYWCVLGFVVGFEYIAEWLISWIPFYHTLKTLFLLYLALPQTQGSSYLYSNHLQPFFHKHEKQIDSALAQLKANVYAFVQQRVRMLWGQVAGSMGQPTSYDTSSVERQLDEDHIVDSAQPPTLHNPVGGAAQLVSTLWTSYGPGILATGFALMRQDAPAVPNVTTGSTTRSGSNALNTPPGSRIRVSGSDSTQSVADRKRQLEAELAALNMESVSGSTATSRGTSDFITRRKGHMRTASGGSTRFEEIEMPSDVEGYEVEDNGQGHVQGGAAGSGGGWFGWGGSGYERVKKD